MIKIDSSQVINPLKDSWDHCGYISPDMLPEAYRSTNASFYVVVRIRQSPLIIESSGQTYDSNKLNEELFLDKASTKEKNSEIIPTSQVEHLKTTLGINISETADILQITRQAIYDWKSDKAIPSVKNQERINKLIAICKKWEHSNLGPIRHLIRQHIWNDFSLFDLFCRDKLDEDLIYSYFDKIKTYITALSKEKEKVKRIKEQHGFKQLSDEEKFEKLKKNSRKIS